MLNRNTLLAIFAFMATAIHAQDIPFQKPPKVIEDMAMAAFSTVVRVNNTQDWALKLNEAPYYSIEELAEPELKLAGQRINPNTFSTSRVKGYESITLISMKDQKEYTVTNIPQNAVILSASWLPAADKAIVAVKESDGVYLYEVAPTDLTAHRVADYRVNATSGLSIIPTSDDTFLFYAVPKGERALPVNNPVPIGPVIQENDGKVVAARTYQDLLKNKYDEDLFDYYFTSQLVEVSPSGVREINDPQIYRSISVSPDKQMMLVSTIERPFSYVVTMYSFPTKTVVNDMDGATIKEIANTPVVVSAMGYDTTSPYPRQYSWRADKPATLTWIEAQDEGNPRKNKVEYSDILYQQEAPFTADKQELLKTKWRMRNVQWCDGDFALATEMTQAKRMKHTFSFSPDTQKAPQTIFELSTNDLYNDLGSPVLVKNEYDKYVVYTDKRHSFLMMRSNGASPEGDMPYLSKYTLADKSNKILWRCQAPYYEYISDVLDPDKLVLLTNRQSQTQPGNYYVRDLKRNKMTAITDVQNPYPMMEGVTKERINYQRADGLGLTATVYLPAGYDKEKDGRLPVLMWAYPREYKSMQDASQVRGSQYRFSVINYSSPVFWVTRGYCVMESVEMPIVGSETTEPNDTYLEQLVMDAEAAVKVITDMGVGDPDRVAVGGHSYGGFMTANLLAHTRLFKAGIARSGAYNRTLTPFGFQSETRTYWEAPEIYYSMSPFSYAHQIKDALLLVHGEMDNNTGTFPIQSERLYNAVKGHGGTARYVVLPYESHGYSAKENILHLLYEEDAWLEKHLSRKEQPNEAAKELSAF